MSRRCMPAYSLELVRLGSFCTWPHIYNDTSFSPRAFAKAGLYYSGNGDEVTCFSCGKSFHDWAVDDDPTVKHFEGSPGCDFIRDLFLAQKRATSFSDRPFLDINENYASSPMAIVPEEAWGCNTNCPRDLNEEQHRLHTFFNWPADCPVTAEDLAAAGFFYLGIQNKVECAFCGGVLHHWEEDEDPRRKHESQFPQCPFIRGDATANIPIGCRHNHQYVPVTLGRRRANEKPGVRFHLQPISSQSSVDTGVPPPWSAPKAPEATFREMASDETRFSTFFHWPMHSPSAPRKLAEAGMYYTGVDDLVKCFWCDGGLKDWQQGDDPWVEHARWYGEECGFVQREKGVDFVQKSMRRLPPTQSMTAQDEETPPKHYVGGFSTSMSPCEDGMPNEEETGDLQEISVGAAYDSEVEDMRSSIEALSKKLHHLREERLCKVCMYSEACMVFMPCGHFCCCEGCADVLMYRRRKCPNCNGRIYSTQRASHQ
ncbi:baculoviral IAP repeat-containing protein 7-B-like [Branchiostoma lanceolatum]|uniref:baculoviral IAP repeat-containing protein 7-B-like n=1 Tax=Branchiostoma lanceolatum TaxID=7740 RepID=UPI0034517A83